jgi:glycosyltransferase involved in cell wall biosynthesis
MDLQASHRIIADLSPELVIWQVPPSIGPVVIGSCGRGARRWGLDMHSGAVNLARWRWLLPILRRRARSATFAVVHNTEMARLIRPWPSPVFVIDNYVVPVHERPIGLMRSATGPVVVAASGAIDEPLELVVQAGLLLGTECEIVITGRRDAIRRRLGHQSLPPSVRLAGFLERRAYLELLASASVTVCLTTRAATMQLGAWEALSLGCPVVVSDQKVLRDYFRAGAQFAAHTPQALADCIRTVRADYGQYSASARQMATFMEAARARQIDALRAHIGLRKGVGAPEDA